MGTRAGNRVTSLLAQHVGHPSCWGETQGLCGRELLGDLWVAASGGGVFASCATDRTTILLGAQGVERKM